MNEQQRQLRRAAAEEFMQSLNQLETLLSEDGAAEAAKPTQEAPANQANVLKKTNRSDIARPGQPPHAR